MKRSLALLCLAALTAAPGCFTVRHEYLGPKKLTPGPGLAAPTRVVEHFDRHDRQFFLLHGGVPVGEPLNGLALAADAAGSHPGVVNLELRDGQDLLDMAVTHIACVFSLLCGSWSVWVEGDVVDYATGAPLARMPAPGARGH